MTIYIKDIIEKKIFISTDDGKKVYKKIDNLLEENKQVEISFKGVSMLISHALNESIGKLYKKFDWEDLNSYLSYAEIDDDDLELLRDKVIPTAKVHFSNGSKIKINT